jgi:hypothetical protein
VVFHNSHNICCKYRLGCYVGANYHHRWSTSHKCCMNGSMNHVWISVAEPEPPEPCHFYPAKIETGIVSLF